MKHPGCYGNHHVLVLAAFSYRRCAIMCATNDAIWSL
jgi:hypothetical protein